MSFLDPPNTEIIDKLYPLELGVRVHEISNWDFGKADRTVLLVEEVNESSAHVSDVLIRGFERLLKSVAPSAVCVLLEDRGASGDVEICNSYSNLEFLCFGKSNSLTNLYHYFVLFALSVEKRIIS